MEAALVDPRILQFRQEWRQRTDAHEEENAALGLAKIEELNGVDATASRGSHVTHQTNRQAHEQAARDLAIAFVDAHRAELETADVAYRDSDVGEILYAPLGTLTLEQTVGALDLFRAAGKADDVTVIDMWLLSEFAPQHINASTRHTVRIPGGGRK